MTLPVSKSGVLTEFLESQNRVGTESESEKSLQDLLLFRVLVALYPQAGLTSEAWKSSDTVNGFQRVPSGLVCGMYTQSRSVFF